MSADSHAADERRRNATLSGPQEAALVALLAGSTVTEAAERASVARPTVSDWLNHDPDFADELARRRAELWDGLRRRLEANGARALDALAGALDDRDVRVRVAAAAKILALLGGDLGAAPPQEHDDRELSPLARDLERRMRAAAGDYALTGEVEQEGA